MLQTYTVSGSFSSSWVVYGILVRNLLGPPSSLDCCVNWKKTGKIDTFHLTFTTNWTSKNTLPVVYPELESFGARRIFQEIERNAENKREKNETMATTEQQKESDGLQDIRESSDTVPRSFSGKFNTLGTLSSQHGNTGGKFRGKNLWKDSPKRCPVNLWIVLISKMTTDQLSILNVVSNLDLRWFCFTIGWEKSRHPLNQSDSKRKPTAFGHLQFPIFIVNFHWLVVIVSLVVIGHRDFFGFYDTHPVGAKIGCIWILFLVAVTEWLKEQSPLTEDELEKLCVNMDDFKVLDMFSRASSSSLVFTLSLHWQMIMLTFVLIDRWFFLWFWFWFFHTPLKTALIQLAKCFFLFLKNIPYLNDCRYMWTAVWEMNMRAIFAVMNTT